MKIFSGYVLQCELVEKVKVSDSLFCQLDVKREMMGRFICILKDSLPDKYKRIAENECLDLEEYCSYTYLSNELGANESYIAITGRTKAFEHKEIKYAKLFKLSKEFITNVNKGWIPFLIRNKDDEEYAELIIEMQGLKIGFY